MNPRHDVDGGVVQYSWRCDTTIPDPLQHKNTLKQRRLVSAFDAITLLSTRRTIENPAFGRNVWFALLPPSTLRCALIFRSHFAVTKTDRRHGCRVVVVAIQKAMFPARALNWKTLQFHFGLLSTHTSAASARSFPFFRPLKIFATRARSFSATCSNRK